MLSMSVYLFLSVNRPVHSSPHLWWPSTHSLSEFVGPQGCGSAFDAAIGWLGLLGRESFVGGRTKIGVTSSLGGAATGVRTGGHSLNKHWHDDALQQLK